MLKNAMPYSTFLKFIPRKKSKRPFFAKRARPSNTCQICRVKACECYAFNRYSKK